MNPLSAAKFAAVSGMKAQASRISLISQNLANVDTPGYHRKIAQFAAKQTGIDGKEMAVRALPSRLDKSPLREIYDPGHALSDEEGYLKTSNVNLLVEITDSREAQRSYEANLAMLNQAREMSKKLYSLLSR